MDKQRDAHVARIKAVQEEMNTAGAIHKRDLRRQLARLQRELLAYDRYHNEVRP